MLLTKSLLGDYLLLIVLIVLTLLVHARRSLNYWLERNVKCVQRPSFRIACQLYKDRDYRHFKKLGEKVYGIYVFLRPLLVVVDPDMIKRVLIKDFHVFHHRGVYYDPKTDPISHHLLFMQGKDDWKRMRAKLTPIFTTGKMRSMFDVVLRCSNILVDGIAKSPTDIDIKASTECFTADIIGTCAFGMEINSLNNPDSQFRYYARKSIESLTEHMSKRIFMNTYPKLAAWLGMHSQEKDITDFFFDFVKRTIDYREANNYRRNDLLQILIDMKNSPSPDDKLTVTEITAQCYLFFLASFETSSSALTFALYEMARHKAIQDRVRSELRQVLSKHDGQITYDSLKEMKYLGQVLDETLRMYPVTHTLKRKCEENYVIPETNMMIEKGTTILIPLMSLHRDEEYYPEPDKFDPERFSEANRSLIPPNVFLPFGDGPRICIGIRFGQMQVKAAIVNLLKSYEVSVSEKTKPVALNPHAFMITTLDPIYLNAKKIS